MKTQTVLAIGAHIGDAELTAGALLASCAVHGGKAVTLAHTKRPGIAALMAECGTSLEGICWDDLGPESGKRLTLKDLPLVVAADCYGQDAFTLGQRAYLEGQNEA